MTHREANLRGHPPKPQKGILRAHFHNEASLSGWGISAGTCQSIAAPLAIVPGQGRGSDINLALWVDRLEGVSMFVLPSLLPLRTHALQCRSTRGE